MNNIDLPPLPQPGETGPHACAIVRLYLAVFDDLSPEQVELLAQHVSACPPCDEEFRHLTRSTRLVGSLPATAPSPRVDQAIIAAITAQKQQRPQPILQPLARLRRTPRRSIRLIGEIVAAAVVIMLALFASLHLSGLLGTTGTQQAFTLPAHLSWSQYVLYHSETISGRNGEVYHISSFHNLGTGQMHVETTMDSQIDVVAVGDEHAMLGMDEIHHVAQWGADAWAVDDSIFDLSKLRRELQAHTAVYLDQETFRGQQVYRIRMQGGLILLLDMHYRPVNVLSSGTGTPLYDTVKLIPASQVSSTMWNMSIPPGFHMGSLPAKP